MSESGTSEDPFFVSMRYLKAMLRPDAASAEGWDTSTVTVEAQTPIRTTAVAERSGDSPDDSGSLKNCDLIDDLQAKLLSAEATVEKERRLRIAVEQERDEVLVECQEAKKLFESPLPNDTIFLKKEARRLIESRQSERENHLKEMDHLHMKMQQAISQRDSMQAKLLSSQDMIQELEKKLANAREIIQVYVAMSSEVIGDNSTTLSTKHARSDDDSASSCQEKLAKARKDSRECDDTSRIDPENCD